MFYILKMSQSLKFFVINIFTDQRTIHNSTSLQEQSSSSTLSTFTSNTTPRSAIQFSNDSSPIQSTTSIMSDVTIGEHVAVFWIGENNSATWYLGK